MEYKNFKKIQDIISISDNVIETLKNKLVIARTRDNDLVHAWGYVTGRYKEIYDEFNKELKGSILDNKVRLQEIGGLSDLNRELYELSMIPCGTEMKMIYNDNAALKKMNDFKNLYVLLDIVEKHEDAPPAVKKDHSTQHQEKKVKFEDENKIEEEEEEDEIPTPKSDVAVSGGAAGGEKTARELFEEQSKEEE